MVVKNAHLSFARETLRTFIDAVAQTRAICELKEPPYFLTVAQRNAYDTAINAWCILFGSDHADNQQIHWKNMFDHDHFRTGLRASLGMSQDQWTAYRKALVDYRNELTAHRDLNPKTRLNPSFDAALLAADFYHEQLRVKTENETGRKATGPTLLEEFDERLSAFIDQALKAKEAIEL
ncbi:hypothetical protein [Caulobacter sp. X]|uniref:hypothetical protein n=1 Tax=Caulobacter sp. X TaxID=2048901 RepID=UPI000C15DC6C|nr:hypothetical protein [Caulobacter sp. X]PIC01168.1 hypothetical protein CSW60_06455 [Caulobacter sp. X]